MFFQVACIMPRMNIRWFALALLFILPLIVPSASPASPTYDVKQYGATGDGITMDTAALQKAIDAAAAAGGGTVVFPAGKYLSGSIDLKSHVTLQLEENAVLLGSTNQPDYHKANYHALVVADTQEDIGICGKGTIDGQGIA